MIYVVSNGNKVTGGPETLHQIAHLFIDNSIEANMVYFNPRSVETPDQYKKYNVPVATKIVDAKENVLIVPESLTYILSKYKKIKKCIAWLSVDNYLLAKPQVLVRFRMEAHGWPKLLYPIAFIILLGKNKIHFKTYRLGDNSVAVHTYNCEYARRFLINNNVSQERMTYFCGPLNDVFFEKASKVDINVKENIILYNPAKGTAFTQKIVNYCCAKKLPAQFVALKNMSADEVSEWMRKSKVYIDFGEFPGPERIPREAVMMGCNIITSKNGSAANEIDIPIPDFLKFEATEENLDAIYKVLLKISQDYKNYYHYYDKYREKVIKQKEMQNERILLLNRMIQ